MNTNSLTTEQKIQELQLSIVYSHSSYHKASLLVSSLLDNFWQKAVSQLAKKVNKINRALANLIKENCVNLWLIYNDSTSCTGWYEIGFQLDYESWYQDNDQIKAIWQGIYVNNNEHYEYILDCFEEIEVKAIKAIEKIMQKENISFYDLNLLAER